LYVLFPQSDVQDINSFSIGCEEYIPEFCYGVHFDSLDELQKIEENEVSVQKRNEKNELLYIDKNNVISTNPIGKPLIETKTISTVVDFKSYPNLFTLKDVMICKKQKFLNKGYDECYMYEFNLSNFVNLETSSNYNAGVNEIELRKNAVLDLKPVSFDYKTLEVVTHSSDAISVHYSFDNVNFKKGNKISLKNAHLFLKFKNLANNNTLYDYYFLLRK